MSREGSRQMEEHEIRLRGKKHHGCLTKIQVLLIQPKVTSMAGNQIMVPNYGGLEFILYVHVSSCVACRLSVTASLRIFAEVQV